MKYFLFPSLLLALSCCVTSHAINVNASENFIEQSPEVACSFVDEGDEVSQEVMTVDEWSSPMMMFSRAGEVREGKRFESSRFGVRDPRNFTQRNSSDTRECQKSLSMIETDDEAVSMSTLSQSDASNNSFQKPIENSKNLKEQLALAEEELALARQGVTEAGAELDAALDQWEKSITLPLQLEQAEQGYKKTSEEHHQHLQKFWSAHHEYQQAAFDAYQATTTQLSEADELVQRANEKFLTRAQQERELGVIAIRLRNDQNQFFALQQYYMQGDSINQAASLSLEEAQRRVNEQGAIFDACQEKATRLYEQERILSGRQREPAYQYDNPPPNVTMRKGRKNFIPSQSIKTQLSSTAMNSTALSEAQLEAQKKAAQDEKKAQREACLLRLATEQSLAEQWKEVGNKKLSIGVAASKATPNVETTTTTITKVEKEIFTKVQKIVVLPTTPPVADHTERAPNLKAKEKNTPATTMKEAEAKIKRQVKQITVETAETNIAAAALLEKIEKGEATRVAILKASQLSSASGKKKPTKPQQAVAALEKSDFQEDCGEQFRDAILQQQLGKQKLHFSQIMNLIRETDLQIAERKTKEQAEKTKLEKEAAANAIADELIREEEAEKATKKKGASGKKKKG